MAYSDINAIYEISRLYVQYLYKNYSTRLAMYCVCVVLVTKLLLYDEINHLIWSLWSSFEHYGTRA